MSISKRPVSFGTLNLQQDGLVASFDSAFSQPGKEIDMAARHGGYARASAINFITGYSLPPMYITIEDSDNFETLRRAIAAAFDTRTAARAYVREDVATGREEYLMCICQSLTPMPGQGGYQYVANLIVDDVQHWREVEETANTWNITASAQTRSIVNTGDMEVYPVYEITPTAAKSGSHLIYKRFSAVWWTARAITNYPVDIGDAAFDTAALVSASKVSSANNIAVFVNGVEVRRWITGFNTANTKIWINLDFNQGMTGKYLGYNDAENVSMSSGAEVESLILSTGIVRFPERGIITLQGEIFTYDGKDNTRRRLLNVSRAEHGSTAATHAVDEGLTVIQHEIYIAYGPGASYKSYFPSDLDSLGRVYAYNDRKPMIDLSASSNERWVWADFREIGKPRSAAWGGVVTSLDHGTFSGTGGPGTQMSPYSQVWPRMGMGVTAREYDPEQVRWVIPLAFPVWRWRTVAHGNTVFDESLLAVPYWSFLANIRYQANANHIFIMNNFPQPTSPVTVAYEYEEDYDVTNTIAEADAPTPASAEYAMAGTGSLWAYVEAVEMDFVSGAGVTLHAEAATYNLDLKLENVTAGEWLTIQLPIKLNETLTIDTFNKTVVSTEGQSNQFQAVRRSSARQSWLRLLAGTNLLKATETGLAGVTIVTRYREQYY